MHWPIYQVPSLAGTEEKMRYDGMRGIGDTTALENAKLLKDAAAKAAAISDAKEKARALAELYARVNNARRNNGLPELPGSVYLDLISRGQDPTTAPIRVPKDASGRYLMNPDKTYVVETITPSGPEPGVVLPPPVASMSKGTMLAAALALAAVGFVVVKKFA